MKTYFNTFILCFLTTYCFAQLSVKNDAYIFAKDALVFVEDDINLDDGTTGTDSRFYLRDEAQLIQGSGSTGNSGLGKLSVYQEGTVNNYAYNYWGSPVGAPSSDNNINAEFSVYNVLNDTLSLTTNTPAIIGTSYDGTSSPLVISNYWLYAYSPGTDYSEWDYIGDGTSIPAGYGFTMKGSTSGPQLYDFAGKPNNGDIFVDVAAEQTTLVGNPYPSALDAYAFIHDVDNSNMTGTLYFWEQDPTVNSHYLTDYIGGYASYTIAYDPTANSGTGAYIESYLAATFETLGADGFPVNGSPSGTGTNASKSVRRYIPIGQGFNIEGATGITGTQQVVFKNSHRHYEKESSIDSQFFRANNSNSSSNLNQNLTNNSQAIQYNADGFQQLPASTDIRRFRLNVDFNNEVTRQLLHNFTPSATNGFDYGLESPNKSPNPRDSYFIDGTTPYVTQAHAYDIDLIIPLVVTIDQDIPLRVRIYDVQNFNDESIYLHDKVTGIYYDLTVLDFNTNLDSGTYSDRFEITFKSEETLTTNEFEDYSFSVFQNNTISQLVIANPESLIIDSVSLVDITGKQMFKKTNLSNNNRYEFSTKNLSDGVYIATITLENNNKLSKKIVITNK
ncbi:putative secreted protein (Por secretion system target) [Lacinutrix venerupis]|uniref:T9SS type A sorting domain-containing protein n=1 Tax=Lacinutrix venerupis TaxID=1486034 RepID=UPI000EB072C7|nr:T9SS type A sorting domain-containing protein [Lacinutrix venerupis]RLJ69000.1 putative secreted protein (Por secretion system target) [Lacinutrix venerupis]